MQSGIGLGTLAAHLLPAEARWHSGAYAGHKKRTVASGDYGKLNKNMNKLTTVILLVSALTASAANHYILAGASGAATGNDWMTAWPNVPATLTRGDIYYIASGNYGSYGFNTAMSGTARITLRKATSADHGTDTGWSSGFASGQAVFGGLQINNTGYITVDGATEWGIKVTVGVGGTGIVVTGWPAPDRPGITIKNVEVAGPAGSAPYPWPVGGDTRCFNAAVWNSGVPVTITDLLISHCYFHGATTIMQTANTVRMIVENTVLADSRILYPKGYDPAAPHDNIAYIQYGTDTTFRFNTISNWDVTGIYPNGTSPGFIRIHDNVFRDSMASPNPAAIWIYGTGTYNLYIYNNTFYNAWWGIYQDSGATILSGVARNNLFCNMYSSAANYSGIAHDYNWYSGASNQGEANGIAGGSTNPFQNAPSNLSIVSTVGASYPRNKGCSLSAEYVLDAAGVTRGADGAWSIGAYEYSSGPGTNPAISVSPSVLTLPPVPQGMTATNYFTVYNAGGGTLSGTASLMGADQGFRILSGASYSLGANQSQTVQIIYNPVGTNRSSQGIIFTGGGGSSNSITGTSLQVMSGLSFESYAGLITAPFDASGGHISQAVDVSNSGQSGVAAGGRALFAFNTSAAGQYTVSADVICTSGASKAFWVSIDEEAVDPTMIWDNYPYSTNWVTRQVSWRGNGNFTNDQFAPKVFDLSAGLHRLIIVGRDANVQLGRITIAPYNSRPNLPPAPTSLRTVTN